MTVDPVQGSFAGKSVLVTGAASGIGLAIADALVSAGAAVALVDIDEPRLAKAVSGLAAAAGRAAGFTADVGNADAVSAAVADAHRALGRLDGLVNCAGIYPVTRLLDLRTEEWDRIIATNLRGPFLLTQAVARRMKDEGGGSIVNVSSTASTVARPGVAHYGASKAALNQFTRVAAVELAGFSIRVNAVLPGVIATGRVVDAASTEEAKRELEAKVNRIPAQRLGQPEEVVPLVLFLLSDAASYCTGGLFTVDGGFSLGLSKY